MDKQEPTTVLGSAAWMPEAAPTTSNQMQTLQQGGQADHGPLSPSLRGLRRVTARRAVQKGMAAVKERREAVIDVDDVPFQVTYRQEPCLLVGGEPA